MNDYDKMKSLFNELGIAYNEDWSMESLSPIGASRAVNWIYLIVDDIEIDFKFSDKGSFEGIGSRIWD